MHPFSYVQAKDEAGAIAEAAGAKPALASGSDIRILAGGTNLIDQIKLNVETPSKLVDINSLPLAQIETLPGGGVRIGALVRNSDCAYDATIQAKYPVLSEAILAGASAQLRNAATTGGNLLQRTRCYYYRDPATPCNKREPGTGCPAIEGFNRIHAVLGTSNHCIATHPSDMAVAMVALDAVVVVKGARGERRIPIEDFHRLPGDTPHLDNNLEPGDLITSVELPGMEWAKRSRYIKVRDRASYAFALVSVACALDIQNGVIRDSRVAMGGVAHKPWRSHEAEKALNGKPATEATFRAAATAAMQNAKTYKENAFKPELARRTLVRTLTQVTAMAI